MKTLIQKFIGEFIVLGIVGALALAIPFPSEAGPFTSKSQNASEQPSVAATDVEGPVRKYRAMHRGKGKHHRGHFAKNLTADERERFKAIRAKLKDNPDIQKARQAVRDADTKEAKRAAWKNLQTVRRSQMSPEDQAFVDQVKAKYPKAKYQRGEGRKHRGMAKLSVEERERMKAIHARLKNIPELKEARTAVKNADSREERKAARNQLKDLRKKHLTAEEVAFLDQVKAKHPKAGKRGQGRCHDCSKTG